MIGWTDSIAAGGVLILTMTNGFLKLMKFGKESNLDIVPVDYVTNMVLASTAYAAQEAIPSLNIVHANSSHLNPITMGRVVKIATDFAKKYPSIKQFQEPGVIHLPQKKVYNSHVFLKETLPANIISFYGSLPYFGSKDLRSKGVQLKKLS